MQPGIALEPAEQARQTGAAAEAADVQLAQTHSCTFYRLSAWTFRTRFSALDRDLRAHLRRSAASLVVVRRGRRRRTTTRRRPTLAVVDGLSADDLRACAGARGRVARCRTRRRRCSLAAHEFERSLDAFPFEFGAILADHAVVSGADPFDGLRVDPADLRRACEVQARSHLLHLREGYLETRGRGDALAELIAALGGAARRAAAERRAARRAWRRPATRLRRSSSSALASRPAALARIAQLTGRKDLSSDEARRLFPGYLDAVERLTAYIDQLESGVNVERRAGRLRRVASSAFVASCIAVALVASGFSRTSAQRRPLPELTKPVNDFANVIDPADEQRARSR